MKRALSKMMLYAFIIFCIPQRGMAMLGSIDENMPDHWVPINKNIKIIVPITLPESEIGTMVDLKVENGLTELYRFVYGDSENQEEIQKTELSKKIDTINKDNTYPVIVNSIDNEQYCHLVIKEPGQECLELYTLDTKLTKSSACVQNTLLSKEILPSIALKKNIITEDRADGLFDIKHCSKELLKKYHPTLIENNKDTCFILYILCHMKETGANDDSCPLYAAFLFIKKNADSLESLCRLNIQDGSNDIDEYEDGGAEGGDTLYSQRVSGTTIDILQDGRVRLNCGGQCHIECIQSPSIKAACWDYTMNHIKKHKYNSCFIDHNSDKPYAFAVYMSMSHIITVQNCKQILECPPSTDALSEITGGKISDIAQATRRILNIAKNEELKRVADLEDQRFANVEAKRVDHLTLIDVFSQPDTTSALLTQALERTDSPEDISSFFLDPKISEQLCKLEPMVMQALSNQLTGKLASNGPDFETTLLQCICNKLNCSYNKKINPDPLRWLIGTSLLEPVLLELQKREIDISLVTQSLFSWDISSFSEESTKQLLTPVDCQRLLQQACTLNQVESAYKLLLTGKCDNCTNSLDNTQENLLSIFARSGFLLGMEYLLERDIASINCQDVNGNTALANASITGHTACVKLLLAKKVMTHAKDNHGASPLHHASSGNVECLQMLIDDGANVNEKDNFGWTPLHNAASSGNAECIIALLAIRGIKVNEQAHGWTPLHYAVNCNNVECARALLNAKDILVNKKNNRGNTVLHLAAQYDYSECLSLLTSVKHIDVNQQNNDGWTPMAIAISSNFKASFEILLAANGIQINTRGNSGCSPLHFAAQLPDTAIINMLLAEDQSQVNIKSDYGLTPLHIAAAFGKVENVKVLLQIDGIQINIRNNHGYTPLICAAINGHLACMKTLLATNSIKVNKACFDAKATALIYAIINKHQDCAKHLINDRRINLTKKSRSLGTPLMQAKAHSLTDIIELIEDKELLNTFMESFNKILKF
ncbi:MAG: ankyrin repeat domain-containing protein [Candidatus Endonucleobacter sp. (ex Gigantidas childressi)]|nr:ankyrin repeat domain-containing protein [Candidatus Endonucleobacter sp. (ex Gigantidas childressi)]